MRPPILLLLQSCLVLISSVTAATATPILDTAGNPLLGGVPYYVLAPQVRGLGNLGLAPNGPCPLKVFLKPFPYGPAALFFPERSQGNSTVLVGEDLSVMFAATTKCSESTQWQLDRKTGLVTTGGAVLPSENISHSRFRIARFEFPNRNFYQFLSCPGGAAKCSTLGVTTEQLLRQTTEVLVVSFMKVPEGSA